MRSASIVVSVSIGLFAHGQSIERQVIGSGGTFFFQAAAGSLSFTVSEAATATLVSVNNTLTQGFQQPTEGDFSTTVRPLTIGADICVYPNPVHDQLLCIDPQARALICAVHDGTGREVLVEQFTFGEERRFQVGMLAPGTYWLTLRVAEGGQWSYPFIKQ